MTFFMEFIATRLLLLEMIIRYHHHQWQKKQWWRNYWLFSDHQQKHWIVFIMITLITLAWSKYFINLQIACVCDKGCNEMVKSSRGYWKQMNKKNVITDLRQNFCFSFHLSSNNKLHLFPVNITHTGNHLHLDFFLSYAYTLKTIQA